MKVFVIAAALIVTLAASSGFAQAPAGQPAPAQPPAQPAKPPAQTPPIQPPVQPPQPPRPFPEGTKFAHIDIQRIATESAEGKASTSKVQALTQKKSAELGEKNKALAANQQKLQQGGAMLSDTARAQLEKEIERQQIEIQRAQQDAQAELQDLQQDLQQDFQKKLLPIIQQIVTEKGILILFSRADAGIVWADPGLDLTAEVIKRFDATASSSQAAPKPAAKPPVQ